MNTQSTLPISPGSRYPSPPRYYHGTRIDLKIGNLVVPGYSSNYSQRKKSNHVYFSVTLDAAVWGAEPMKYEVFPVKGAR